LLKNYTIDTITGFLSPSPLCSSPVLTVNQKLAFLAKYAECFNISKAAKAAQTTRALVSLHIKEDKAFSEAFLGTQNELLDDIEESLYKQSKKSPIAAMQFLRAKRPGDWGVKKSVEGPTDKTSNKLKELLDAE